MTYTEQELRDALRREWRSLREAKGLDFLLRPARTHQWVSDRGLFGYALMDYQVRTDVSLRGLSVQPVLVEHYWTVRTLDSRQDPNWEPALNINVVHLYRSTVHAAHVDQALRSSYELRCAAWRQCWFGENPKRANLYVRAVALGSAVGEDASMIANRETTDGVSVCIAAYKYGVGDGFTFDADPHEERLWCVATLLPEESAQLGADLFSADALPKQEFRWVGVNDGPVWDHETGLTTHNGRVL